MTHRLSKLPQTSLREQIVNAIRDAIIEGKFKAGEKIPEQELAEQLGVSRTPIREAIRVLEHQGLVEIRPKNGTYIASLNLEEARDGLHVRAALEELAVRQAIERLNPREWEQFCQNLQHLLDGMGDAVARGDPVAATELDIEWHSRLIDTARNRYLSRAWRNTGLPFLIWSIERELYPLPAGELAVFNVRHQELLTVFRRRDPDECGEAVRFHILRKLSDLHQ